MPGIFFLSGETTLNEDNEETATIVRRTHAHPFPRTHAHPFPRTHARPFPWARDGRPFSWLRERGALPLG